MSLAAVEAPVHRFGWGVAGEVGDLVAAHAPRHVLLVTGRASYVSSGAEAALAPVLGGRRVSRFSEFEINPRIQDVERGVAMCRRLACDLVIGVGGGTALDIAKSVRLLAAQQAEPRSYVVGGETITRRGPPLIAVPTTAGSGSEATQFAVVYVDGVKHSLDHPWVRPEYSVVDPALSLNLPAPIAASTGMDALAHAIESYWSVRSTDESRSYAVEAISLVMAHLVEAVTRPSPASREPMARAAHVAGMAINISRTTACHAISYPITVHHGVPHGHAVALTLPHMLVYNAGVTAADVADERGVAWVRDGIDRLAALIGASDAEGAGARLLALMRAISLETSLEALGIRDVETIVAEAFNQRLHNNPRRLTEASLRHVLAAAAGRPIQG
ncbi:MAG TPA: phosphonoacetaldehyde reductase [Candidatus Limnocylindria bacterium]|nr:phosphonoacetaldehyde reductase [Candidatus Limnocylindria bacterium]